MTLKLHVFPLSPRAFKVLWCANHLGLNYQIAPVDFTKGTNKTPAFLALNPNARMPVLEDDGFVLWESNAIVNYLSAKNPEAGLLPAEPRARAMIEQWQFWDSCHWDPAGAIFVYERVVKPLFGMGAGLALRIRARRKNVRAHWAGTRKSIAKAPVCGGR